MTTKMTANDFLALVCQEKLENILRQYPIAKDFLANYRLEAISGALPFPRPCKRWKTKRSRIRSGRFGLLQNFCEFLETFSHDEESLSKVSP
jgi:hypothetical protein